MAVKLGLRRTGSELAEAAETLICLNTLQSGAGEHAAPGPLRASLPKRDGSPTRVRAEQQMQRSGSGGSGQRRLLAASHAAAHEELQAGLPALCTPRHAVPTGRLGQQKSR